MRRAVTAFAGVLLLAVVAGPVLLELWRQPLQSIRVSGPFVHVSKQALEEAIAPYIPRAFFMVDVFAIRRAARTIPWVADVSVRRVWPDRLDIEVRERVAVARWRERELLEQDGHPFAPENLEQSDSLPVLAGPEGGHFRVLERYRELDRITQRYLRVRVASLELNGSGSWVAGLANGIVVQLGADTFDEFLPRYARAFPSALGARLEEVGEIDLRYGNGFAVRWRKEVGEPGGEAEA